MREPNAREVTVTEQELADLLKSQGWTLGRGETGKQSVYSAKRYRKEGNITRYIGTAHKLADMTAADVLGKLRQ